MSSLFSPKTPAPPKPTPLPDEQTIEAARRREQQQAATASSARRNQLTPRPAQTGQEFTRTTLG